MPRLRAKLPPIEPPNERTVRPRPKPFPDLGGTCSALLLDTEVCNDALPGELVLADEVEACTAVMDG